MKKLMVILGAVVLAAGVQAATVNWSTGKFELPNANGSGFSGSTLSAATDGAYLATIYFFTDSACKTAVEGVTGTTDSTSTKTGKAFNNTTSDSFTAGSTYYTYLTLLDNTSKAELKSEVVSFTVDPLQDPILNFWTGSGFNESFTGTTGAFPSAGWTAAPEPTSGLLLLLGVAGLALKRKRA